MGIYFARIAIIQLYQTERKKEKSEKDLEAVINPVIFSIFNTQIVV